MRWPWHKHRIDCADAVSRVRAQYRALGIPEVHLSDDEIVALVRAVARACAEAGISFEEAQRAMAANAEAVRRFGMSMAEMQRAASVPAVEAARRLANAIEASAGRAQRDREGQ